MSISDIGVRVQNGAKSSLVVEVKEKKEINPILLKLKGAVHNQRVDFFSKREMVYFATRVDCVLLMWAS